MPTVPTFVLEERLPGIDLPLLRHAPRFPHNYGIAVHLFEMMVRADAITDQAYGPHTGNRLVLTQAGPAWRPARRCRNCDEAIWKDAGVNPDYGIWMHMHRDPERPELGFLGMCDPEGPGRAEPAAEGAGAVDAGHRRQLRIVARAGAR